MPSNAGPVLWVGGFLASDDIDSRQRGESTQIDKVRRARICGRGGIRQPGVRGFA